MAFSINKNQLTHTSRRALLTWLGTLVLVVVFGSAILAMWAETTAHIPFWFKLVFTAISVGVLPVLVKQCLSARFTSAVFNSQTKTIDIKRTGLFKREHDQKCFSNIERAELRSYDDEFFKSFIVFSDGSELLVSHGSLKQGVIYEQSDIVEFLERTVPDIQTTEVRT